MVEFVSFAIGGDRYGVDIMAVREIKDWSSVTHLPKQPDYVRGVLNLRGVVMPIVDLRCRFGQGLTEVSPASIIIIVQIDGRQVGLLADQVLDIVSFEQGKIQAVPRTNEDAASDFLSGLVTDDNGMIALIDLRNLLEAPMDFWAKTFAAGNKKPNRKSRRDNAKRGNYDVRFNIAELDERSIPAAWKASISLWN